MTLFSKLTSKKGRRGSTLIELLLYIGIFSILTAVLFQFFGTIIDTQLESQSTSSVLLDGQYALNRFNYDIKRADSIISPAIGEQSSTLQLSIDSITYTYTLIDGDITIASSGTQTTDQLNSVNTNSSNLSFTHLGDTQSGNVETITISFTLASDIANRGNPEARNYKSTFGIRPRQ
ncbi:MAG: prepilin-type N-terminal cleavage/methylation domain-containing protein [Patescibacteria group bacterium]